MTSPVRPKTERVDPFKSLELDQSPSQGPIRHTKVTDDNDRVMAAFAAVEILTWQLVVNRVLLAGPLADELSRYAHLNPDAERFLKLLARVARAAASDEEGF